MLSREETLAVLRRQKADLRSRYGVTALGIFGSVARGEADTASDVDVVVRLAEPNLFTLVHVKETLEEALHEHVDVVHYRERMNAYLKGRIDREAIYV